METTQRTKGKNTENREKTHREDREYKKNREKHTENMVKTQRTEREFQMIALKCMIAKTIKQ